MSNTISEEDIARLKEIFVTRDECNNTVDAINKEMYVNNTKLALIAQQNKTIIWLSKTTFGAVIAGFVGMIFNWLSKRGI